MISNKIAILVIQTPGSNRSAPLLNLLADDQRFDLHIIQAKMLKITPSKLDFPFSDARFQYFEGRRMLPGEIGCALSHNLAHKYLVDSKTPGVVLEDDARIDDVDFFYSSIVNFFDNKIQDSSILSLTGFRYDKFKDRYERTGKKKDFVKLLGRSDLAVGYAVTRSAAVELFESNKMINYVADWPENKCSYFVSLCPAVVHGDSLSGSNIPRSSKTFRSAIFHRLKMLTFFSYFFQNKLKVSFFDYFWKVFAIRFFWHLDTLSLKRRLSL